MVASDGPPHNPILGGIQLRTGREKESEFLPVD